MQLTRFGRQHGAFFSFMVLAFYASPYSNLFFLLLAFLTIQWGLGLAAARRNLRDIEVAIRDVPPQPAGPDVALPVELRAAERLRFQVALELQLADGARLYGELDVLQDRSRLNLRAAEGGLARGCHAVVRSELNSIYPFGMLRVGRPVEGPREVVVYPAPKVAVEGRSAAEVLDELLGADGTEAGDLQPAGLREHRDGDEVRAIHWRASARLGNLVVQEWEGARGQGLEVVLERRCAGHEQRAAFEDALASLSALVAVARTNKENLTLHSQELSATFGEGHRPWTELLRFLAAVTPLPESAAGPPPTAPHVLRLPRAVAA